MDFKNWLITEGKVPVQQLPENVLKSIQYIVGGDWSFITPPKNDVPSLRYQWRFVCEISGTNVRREKDKFYVKLFIEAFKKQDWIVKEPEAPAGYFGGANWWGPSDSLERYKKMMNYGNPYEKITTTNPTQPNPLIKYAGRVEGWRPGKMPDSEIDHLTSMQIKQYPFPVSKPGQFRHDMELIGRFSQEPKETGPWPDHRLNTPTEVAHYIKKVIDQFYDNRGDDDEPEPDPVPTPSFGKKITAYK
jgi:hypothetical protein